MRPVFHKRVNLHDSLAAWRWESMGGWWFWLGVVWLVVTLQVRDATAQVERLELGKRLRRFEEAWQTAPVETRAKSVPPMESAVKSFFSLQFRTAAARLDDAWLTVRQATPPTRFERWAIAMRLQVAPRCMDTTNAAIVVQLKPYYDIENVEMPAETKVIWRLHDSRKKVVAELPVTFEQATQAMSWMVGEVPAGEYLLTATVQHDQQSVTLPPTVVSRVDRWRMRLTRIEEATRSWPDTATHTARATVASLLSLLKPQAVSQVHEIDYPAGRLVQTCEALIADQGQSPQVLAKLAREGDVWATLATSSRQIPARLRAPAQATGPLPVLLLFHGAGGSENMFFETYGAGRAVTLGLERGWLVVAPRQPLFGSGPDAETIVRVLSEHFEIDRRRIFLMGHSMGARHVTQQVSRYPDLPAAVVALGGGGSVTKQTTSRPCPWFVAAGQFDFGLKGAASLAARLRETGNPVTFREYPDVEHMVIVQAALDEAFVMLDQAAGEGRAGGE